MNDRTNQAPADALVAKIASDSAGRVVTRAVKHLCQLPAQLSGDDSGLGNVWEEFCVQVQGEESIFWDEYVETVKDSIRGALVTTRPNEVAAMWLRTWEGRDWAASNDAMSSEGPPVANDPDVVEWIYHEVWSRALSAKHPRVLRFLRRHTDD